MLGYLRIYRDISGYVRISFGGELPDGVSEYDGSATSPLSLHQGVSCILQRPLCAYSNGIPESTNRHPAVLLGTRWVRLPRQHHAPPHVRGCRVPTHQTQVTRHARWRKFVLTLDILLFYLKFNFFP